MRKFFVLTTIVGFLSSNVALADSQEISAALSAVTNAKDGVEIAHGLLEIGQSLNIMSIDDTIALRTSLALLLDSGVVTEDSPEWKMIQTLGRASAQHMITACLLDPTVENVTKVNSIFGWPRTHCSTK